MFANTAGYDFHGHRAQTQERLTEQVAQHPANDPAPRGVGVVIEAQRTSTSLRGVRAPGARTVASALGTLRTDPSSGAEFPLPGPPRTGVVSVIARETFAISSAPEMAAGRAVQELRESGLEGHIVLYGAEAHPPYERPPLSKLP